MKGSGMGTYTVFERVPGQLYGEAAAAAIEAYLTKGRAKLLGRGARFLFLSRFGFTLH
jgi:site-specific recombinase XerD